MVPLFKSLEAFVRGRLYARRYPAALSTNDHVLAHRLDHGEYPVVYTTVGNQYPLGAANFLGDALRGRPALFLLFFTWASHPRHTVRRSLNALAVYRQQHPQHRFVILCNTEAERQAHANAGLHALHCNDNAFVDETIFTPGDGAIEFNAVYNAAMVAWKRQELARLIPSCIHITYKRRDVAQDVTMARLAELQRIAPSHMFANPVVRDEIQSLSAEGVAAVLRRAGCGLCLSAVEGAMWASIEYLLAGLPVVSTPSEGGREEFADPDYWLTVAPDAKAVAAGVSEILGRRLSRDDIRSRTLARMHRHRDVLRETVARETNGRVELPTDLGSAEYRFITQASSHWLSTRDLPATLLLQGAL